MDILIWVQTSGGLRLFGLGEAPAEVARFSCEFVQKSSAGTGSLLRMSSGS
jgi:hypothetical protein